MKNSDSTVLEIRNVTKVYKNRKSLNHINFKIKAGEIFGFLGPNGAGKTTLIRVICGMTKPTEGEVFICGTSVQKHFEKAIVNLGAMIENCQAYSYMSGYQNLVYYANLYGKADYKYIDSIVSAVGMTERIHDKVKTYSYGMRQRIGLAQALLHHPKVLVLDEPTNGLDANGVIELRQTLKDLAKKQKMGILISSHILSEMEQICDTFAVVDRGIVLEIKNKNNTKTTNFDKLISINVNYPNFACKVIHENFGISAEIAGSCVLIPYEQKLYKNVMKLLKEKNITIFNIRLETKSLEELYLDILKENQRR